MKLTLFDTGADTGLAARLTAELGVEIGALVLGRFPDGEAHVELTDSVRGHDVYVLAPTAPPADARLMELLLVADASRRAGAARITAVMPYFAYARQDRRKAGREPVAARLVADLVSASGITRVVAVDLHGAALEGFFSVPLEHLTAAPSLAARLRRQVPKDGVVVAPDLGAAHLADRFARELALPVAVVHKTRASATEVSVRTITGEVRGRVPILVDDMISTGGTIAAAIEALLASGAQARVQVAATHGLFVGGAPELFAGLPIERLIVTDSVPARQALPDMEVVSLAPLLASAIQQLHHERSIAGLRAHR